jgi:hypothetical protein
MSVEANSLKIKLLTVSAAIPARFRCVDVMPHTSARLLQCRNSQQGGVSGPNSNEKSLRGGNEEN